MTVVVAGHVYDGAELVPRLSAMAAALPADHPLAVQCSVQVAASELEPRAGLPHAVIAQTEPVETAPGRSGATLAAASQAAT